MQTALEGGFADPPRDAAHAFRAIMTAMARPGTIHQVAGAVPPPGLSPAAATVVLTLCDPDTGLWLAPALDTAETRAWIDFHTGAPQVAAADAVFAVGSWAALPRGDLPVGTPDYPDRSTTLIVEMPDLVAQGATLTGPGIETRAQFNLPDVAALQANAAQFPLGHDFIFCAGHRLAALPRSTTIGDA